MAPPEAPESRPALRGCGRMRGSFPLAALLCGAMVVPTIWRTFPSLTSKVESQWAGLIDGPDLERWKRGATGRLQDNPVCELHLAAPYHPPKDILYPPVPDCPAFDGTNKVVIERDEHGNASITGCEGTLIVRGIDFNWRRDPKAYRVRRTDRLGLGGRDKWDHQITYATCLDASNRPTPAVPDIKVWPKWDVIQRSKSTRGSVRADAGILVFFIDSMGRASFHRKMPLTNAVIQKHTSTHHINEFYRMNVLGAATANNAPAFLEGCIYNTDADCESLAKIYKKDGWIRFYSADSQEMVFEYLGNSNSDEKFSFVGSIEGEVNEKGEKLVYWNNHITIPTRACVRGKRSIDFVFESLWKYLEAYDGNPRAGWVHANTVHGPDNSGTEQFDPKMAAFLDKVLTRWPMMSYTFIGDHGAMYGKFARTPTGIVEAKNPIFLTGIPRSLLTPTQIANMEHNEQEPVGQLDVYATLRSGLPALYGATEGVSMPKRGVNLLAATVPPKRTCSDMIVDPGFCICNTWTNTDLNTTEPSGKDRELWDRLVSTSVSTLNMLGHKKEKLCRGYAPEDFTFHLRQTTESINKSRERRGLYQLDMRLVGAKEKYGQDVAFMFHAKSSAVCNLGAVISHDTHPFCVDHKSGFGASIPTDLEGKVEVRRSTQYDTMPFCTKAKDVRPYCVCNN